jgi:hypothetical protein
MLRIRVHPVSLVRMLAGPTSYYLKRFNLPPWLRSKQRLRSLSQVVVGIQV